MVLPILVHLLTLNEGLTDTPSLMRIRVHQGLYLPWGLVWMPTVALGTPLELGCMTSCCCSSPPNLVQQVVQSPDHSFLLARLVTLVMFSDVPGFARGHFRCRLTFTLPVLQYGAQKSDGFNELPHLPSFCITHLHQLPTS